MTDDEYKQTIYEEVRDDIRRGVDKSVSTRTKLSNYLWLPMVIVSISCFATYAAMADTPYAVYWFIMTLVSAVSYSTNERAIFLLREYKRMLDEDEQKGKVNSLYGRGR